MPFGVLFIPSLRPLTFDLTRVLHLIIAYAKNKKPLERHVLFEQVSELLQESTFRELVEHIAKPRHFVAENRQNVLSRDYIADYLSQCGYVVKLLGDYGNVLALPRDFDARQAIHAVGAHYDSVPGSPGADDNGSAIAAMLQCAKVLSVTENADRCAFIAFNCEEDHLIGSRDFVDYLKNCQPFKLAHLDVLEMLGYRDSSPNSQTLPRGIPIRVPNTADFLALIGNKKSNRLLDNVLSLAQTYVPQANVLGLKIFAGLEKFVHHVKRSDHAPFWEAGYSAMMWTDTAEFRNPHYHRASDTPDTLDYAFLRYNTLLLCMHVLWHVERLRD